MPNPISFAALKNDLSASDRMPIAFIGHGSPMNAIVDNPYAKSWIELGKSLPRPQAILVISAHWMTQGNTLVDISELPRTIHDFGRFPDELFAQQYPAPGQPALAKEVVSLLHSHHAEEDDSWGLDHGAWTVLKFLYPEADVPVFQLSIDMTRDFDWHITIGRDLAELRDRGVLIIGSGNIVHNLPACRRAAGSIFSADAKVAPLDFASAFDAWFADRLEDRDFAALAGRGREDADLKMAHPTVDHYLPALSVAGAVDPQDQLMFMNDTIDMGALSMRSFVFYGS